MSNPNVDIMNKQPWDSESNYMLANGARTKLPPGFKPIISFLIGAWNPREEVKVVQGRPTSVILYPWLEQAVESCLTQSTGIPFEVILVDDGSERPIKLQTRDPRVRILRIQHSGLAAALNAGLAVCSGELIMRLDADDIACPWRIAKSAAIGNYDLIGGSMGAIVNKGSVTCRIPVPKWSDAKAQLANRQVLCWHPTWCIRRETLLKAGGYPLGYDHAEDFALQCQLVVMGARIKNIPDMLTYYRRHAGQMSSVHHADQAANTLRAIEDILMPTYRAELDAKIISEVFGCNTGGSATTPSQTSTSASSSKPSDSSPLTE